MTAPSILVIDDGELDRVQELLARMSADWVRCLEPDCAVPLESPRDLIISSGPRAMKMPPLSSRDEPLWVCIYDQDFLPLRERLRDLGVHYLVSGDLAPRIFELFVRQLLHRGEERRQVRRIPLHCELELEVGFERRKALLLELSREACLFSTDAEIPLQRRVIVRLPAALTGDEDLDLPGSVLRSNGTPGSPGGVTTVFRFGSLDADAMARISGILSGNALATQVTPLRSEPISQPTSSDEGWFESQATTSEGWRSDQGERRAAPRRDYLRCVDAIRWQGERAPQIVFARDLSLTGLRIATSPVPGVGSEVAIALYGGVREEPVLVEARVVRVDGEEAGLRFQGLTPVQRRGIERLVLATPRLELLTAQDGSFLVAELIDG